VGPIIFLGVMLLVIWLFLIQPQRRRQQAQRQQREHVDIGDEILTAGGVYATVEEVRENDLTVEIAPGTRVRLDKRAVAVVVNRVNEGADDEEIDADADAEPDELEPALEHEAARDEEPSQAGRT
jgi:preprotein translocase subunit YajC